jgi:DNA-binding response OmpR family regulator
MSDTKTRVVVADDSALARSLILQSLADLNLDIIQADSGNSVIRAINQFHPALAILDICMPYPDGLTVLRKIRNDPEFCNMHVIMCSVENGAMERAEADMLGVSGYLTKPFDMRLLRDMVEVILEDKKKSAKIGVRT